MVETMSVW